MTTGTPCQRSKAPVAEKLPGPPHTRHASRARLCPLARTIRPLPRPRSRARRWRHGVRLAVLPAACPQYLRPVPLDLRQSHQVPPPHPLHRPLAPPRPRLGPEDWRVTQEIATQLGETERGPRGHVGRVVGRLGADRARTFLTRTQEIEAAGGLMLPDGSCRRTPGGVFFHLVRADDTLSREDRVSIFPSQSARNGRTKAAAAAATPVMPAPPAPVLSSAWADNDYQRVMAALQQETGRATTVKITVIGRPCTIVEQGQAVALALVSEKVPDLPKGLPEPPAGTRYTVFVARKQWGKIAEALAADAEDAAIIAGDAALDPRVEGIAVYATSATTKRTQAAKRATTAAATP